MEMVSWLADVYGPRMAGSPSHKQAAAWAAKKMTELGFANVHVEKWPFGKGSEIKKFHASMTEPQVMPIIGTMRAWTRGTNGPIAGEVVLVVINSEADFEKCRGKLAGKIVLTQTKPEVRPIENRVIWRIDDALLKEAEMTPITPARAGNARPGMAPVACRTRLINSSWTRRSRWRWTAAATTSS